MVFHSRNYFVGYWHTERQVRQPGWGSWALQPPCEKRLQVCL